MNCTLNVSGFPFRVGADIDQERCSACGACLRNCPVNAVNKSEEKVYTIIQEKCIKCGACFTACPEKCRAVIKVPSYTFQKQPAAAANLTAARE